MSNTDHSAVFFCKDGPTRGHGLASKSLTGLGIRGQVHCPQPVLERCAIDDLSLTTNQFRNRYRPNNSYSRGA